MAVGHYRAELIPRPSLRNADLPLYDEAFAFLALTFVLFAISLGALVPVLVVLLLGAFFVVRPAQGAQALLSNWIVLLLPAFALLSVVWSIEPSTSAYYGVQYLLTAILGILLGSCLDSEKALNGIFGAFAIFSVASMIFGQTVSWGGTGTAFAGLVASKNSMGDIAAIGALASLAFLFRMIGRRWVLTSAAAAVVLLLQLFQVGASQSSGAVISAGLGIGVFAVLGASRAIPGQYRVLLGLVGLATIFILFVQRDLWFEPLMTWIMEAFGKSPTLTGRTPIWEHGQRLVAERPVFGLGFSAFWLHGNLDAEGIWRSMGIGNRSGFNFHNTPLELLVHLGYVGLILFAAVFLFALVKLVAVSVSRPTLPLMFWASFMVYQVTRMYAESRGLKLFDYGTVLLFAAMAMGLRYALQPPETNSSRPAIKYRGS
ncbi:O-antigen ligase family protein [Alteraurantiacibacter aquimixticola]|uniref:O-antigen ligase family protein n=1 Tax=Alteraurantiacibacter aquimixticola TaxID=2489173 RepID=A0A4T3F249_9SPHN|nr:O-antigen ligase family protein [Alteraurantiacibacter aquimixticola]TIX51246.1 O-antigen ligase family protein [Alteraurantiacibacter aquimixticola]